jgi:hypothetical protein
MSMVLGLATGGTPVSIDWFGYKSDSYELVALIYSWVTYV